MRTRDEKTKKAFIKFLEENKHLRFWQSIYAFTKAPYILIAEKRDMETGEFSGFKETFYIESDEELKNPNEQSK